MLETAIAESEPFPPFLEGPASIYKFPLQGEGTIEERVENISMSYRKLRIFIPMRECHQSII